MTKREDHRKRKTEKGGRKASRKRDSRPKTSLLCAPQPGKREGSLSDEKRQRFCSSNTDFVDDRSTQVEMGKTK